MRFLHVLAILLLSAASSVGVASASDTSSPARREPNTTITETLIGYGRTMQRAEEDALQEAKLKAFDGEYELKSISLSGREDDYYCVIQIQHDIYQPENRRAIEEMTVGYGRTLQQADADARLKAERMIDERLRSAKERRARQRIADAERDRRQSAALENPYSGPILDKDDDQPYILKQIRFSGRTDDWLCYIKFQYLVAK